MKLYLSYNNCRLFV